MKEVKIYHRKDLVEQLKRLIEQIEWERDMADLYGFVWGDKNAEEMRKGTRERAGYIRQHRIKYGLYETF